MKVTAIIRDRGQLTIPDSIRKTIKWVTPMSAVSVILVKPNEIVIQPQHTHVDWEDIWAGIKTARAIHGKPKATSAAEFLEEDRAAH